VGLIDTNHNAKNFRYQFLGASSAVWIGHIVFDTELFRLAGVSKLLWRVKDFASDLLVLELASLNTMNKLCSLEGESAESVKALAVTLYFLRTRLYAVNGKVLGYRTRVRLMWCSMIWITSLGYKPPLGTNKANMLANKRNCVTETIGASFLVVRKDVVRPRGVTTEGVEHTFALIRSDKKEATVLEMT